MSAGWVAENEALSDSGMDFNDLVTLKPRHVGAITELPRQLIQQSSPDINSLVRDDLAKMHPKPLNSSRVQGLLLAARRCAKSSAWVQDRLAPDPCKPYIGGQV